MKQPHKFYKVIGIAGPAQCGKDTAANHIINTTNQYVKASFAGPLKEMLAIGLNLTHSQLYGDDKETVDVRYGCTARHMMQTLGTEWGRDLIAQDIWVNAMRERVKSAPYSLIIPDVRFESEADFIREHGLLIHIQGRGRVIPADHQSEIGVAYVEHEDIRIRNNSSLECYFAILDDIIKELLT